MARTRKKAIWVDTETTYGSDPSTNGSGYLWIPATELGELQDGLQPLATNYATGENFDTATIAGADGWTFSCTVPLIGMATSAGDEVDAASVGDDWLDAILNHVFGTQDTNEGEAIVSVPDSTGIVFGDTEANVAELLAVHEDDAPSASAERVQWAFVTADNGGNDYDIAPAWESNPTSSGVSYGAKHYSFDDNGGASLAFVYLQDDIEYLLLGGRCTSAAISMVAGQIATMALTFSGDTKTVEGTTKVSQSLPASGSAPAVEPCKGLISPFHFNGTKYAVASVEIALNLDTSPIGSSEAVNGRSEYEHMRAAPMITVNPLRTTTLVDLKRNQTKGRLLVQIGSGKGDGTPINSLCVHAEEAVAQTNDPADDAGTVRTGIDFKVSDSGTGASTSSALRSRYFFQMARA